MTDDIVAFIRVRLDEVEARVHSDIEWWFDECAISATMYGGNTVAGADDYIRPFVDPARVLRGVEAKRRIVELHSIDHDPCDAHSPDLLSIPCEVVLLLATEWSTHPDFRPEWTL